MKIDLSFDTHYDKVVVDGNVLSPERSLALFNHSPDGFSWGYGGSGPAQLALALLLEAGVDDDTAVRLHQDFKWQFVANWSHDGQRGVQTYEVDIDEWVAEQTESRSHA